MNWSTLEIKRGNRITYCIAKAQYFHHFYFIILLDAVTHFQICPETHPHKRTDLNLRTLVANVIILITRTSIKCEMKEPLTSFMVFDILSA